MDYLEVLNGGLCDPAVEVEHMRRRFFVPHRRFIVKLDQILHPSILVPYQQAITFLSRGSKVSKRKKKKNQRKTQRLTKVSEVALKYYNQSNSFVGIVHNKGGFWDVQLYALVISKLHRFEFTSKNIPS